MRSASLPARGVEAVTLDVDGETLIYHRRTGEVHRLDSVGSLIWRFLDGQTAAEELVHDLSEAFAVEPEVVRSDVDDLLKQLGQAFLLADQPSPPPRPGPLHLTNPPSP